MVAKESITRFPDQVARTGVRKAFRYVGVTLVVPTDGPGGINGLLIIQDGFTEKVMTDPMLNKSDANNKAFLKKLEPVLWLFTPVKSDGTPVKSMPEYTKKCLVIIIDECVEVNEEFIRDFHTNTFIPAIKEVGGRELKDYVVPYIIEGQFYRQIAKWTTILSSKAALMMYSKAFCGWAFSGKTLMDFFLETKGNVHSIWNKGKVPSDIQKMYKLESKCLSLEDVTGEAGTQG